LILRLPLDGTGDRFIEDGPDCFFASQQALFDDRAKERDGSAQGRQRIRAILN